MSPRPQGTKAKRVFTRKKLMSMKKAGQRITARNFFLFIRLSSSDIIVERTSLNTLLSTGEECRAGCGPALSWRGDLLPAPAEEI